jgi:hypothetical protein
MFLPSFRCFALRTESYMLQFAVALLTSFFLDLLSSAAIFQREFTSRAVLDTPASYTHHPLARVRQRS